MGNNLSINQLKTLISYLRTQYKDYETTNQFTQFDQRWEKILLTLQSNDCSIIASSYEADDQIFQKAFMFSNVELSMLFDIKIALSLCEKHIPITNIPIELFEIQPHNSSNRCFIYHPTNDDVSLTINQPIIIADIPVVSNVSGYVIDGNHRVSQFKSMCRNCIQSYLLNERVTFICLRSMLHKAIYLYLCDISNITSGKMTNFNLCHRIDYLEDYCKKKLL